MKAILYIGHGTRSKKGVQELKAFMQHLIKRSEAPIQEISFLKLTEPSIEVGFERCVERGATEITVIPLFLLAASHIKEDIPQALSSLSEKYPTIKVNVKNPLGVQDKIVHMIADSVKEAVPDLGARDSILIVGVGGSDPSIPLAFENIITVLEKRLGHKDISICYLAAAKPSLQEGFEIISKKPPNRLIVIPYLFFPGQLLALVNQQIRELEKHGQSIIAIEPLSSHQVILDLVLQSTFNEERLNICL
ncbi:MAG TPA: sirohydrochlorin chelatase [Bacillus bacterium]|nr:sirohydrochlorin chelatase [Bacillus sp. (in: firmicutes)]